ncbi:MAG: hypothetical protein R3D29_16135 [Nitratireductor sp.]
MGDAAEMIRFFCLFVVVSFSRIARSYVAFNNLGSPVLSMLVFNWGVPRWVSFPLCISAWPMDHRGLAGWGLGGVVFGALAVIVASRKSGNAGRPWKVSAACCRSRRHLPLMLPGAGQRWANRP